MQVPEIFLVSGDLVSLQAKAELHKCPWFHLLSYLFSDIKPWTRPCVEILKLQRNSDIKYCNLLAGKRSQGLQRLLTITEPTMTQSEPGPRSSNPQVSALSIGPQWRQFRDDQRDGVEEDIILIFFFLNSLHWVPPLTQWPESLLL